jgi:hypothetical protein
VERVGEDVEVWQLGHAAILRMVGLA